MAISICLHKNSIEGFGCSFVRIRFRSRFFVVVVLLLLLCGFSLGLNGKKLDEKKLKHYVIKSKQSICVYLGGNVETGQWEDSLYRNRFSFCSFRLFVFSFSHFHVQTFLHTNIFPQSDVGPMHNNDNNQVDFIQSRIALFINIHHKYIILIHRF